MHKILVVDDEAGPRLALQWVLQKRKIADVVICDSPAAAIDLYRETNVHFDLVIVDLRMPGMLGTQLVTELRKIDPKLKAVLHTGYDDWKANETTGTIFQGRLIKPASNQKIVETITELLGS